MTKTVSIFGATGAQGAPVVREALARGMAVRAVARDAAKVAQAHPKAQAVAATLDNEASLVAALTGVDAAFLHLPMPTGPDAQQTWLTAFIGAAHKAKLPLLVYTTGGATGERFPSSVIIEGGTAGMNALLGCGIPTSVLQPVVYLENLLPPIFMPRLHTEGVLDYPPLPRDLKVQWTSHDDQARIVAAALDRPDLAGKAYEIGTPDALTGDDLAALLGDHFGRPVHFDPMTPDAFGLRVGNAIGNPGAAFALADSYGAIAQMHGDAMAVDTAHVEETFGVTLDRVADHIARWPKGG